MCTYCVDVDTMIIDAELPFVSLVTESSCLADFGLSLGCCRVSGGLLLLRTWNLGWKPGRKMGQA